MTHRDLGFHHICSQRPTPVLSTSAYFNKFAVLARTYSVRLVNSVRSCVPSFIPSYSDRVQVHVSFPSLSQFYGSWNPRAPVFVVCLCSCLLAQRCSGTSSRPLRIQLLIGNGLIQLSMQLGTWLASKIVLAMSTIQDHCQQIVLAH